MQKNLRGFKAADGVVLDLKLMLGHGTVVGNYLCSTAFSHCEFLISGDPMTQIMEIDKTIMPGEIILSKEMLTVVNDSVIIKSASPTERKQLLGINLDGSHYQPLPSSHAIIR